MKDQLKYIAILPLVLILFTGCSKFLEEKSQDELRPSNIQDLTAVMAGDGYPYQSNITPFFDLMTDDIQCNGGQSQKNYVDVIKKGRAPFLWSKDVYQELLLPGGWGTITFLNTWKIAYGKISGCNTVLDYTDKVTGSDLDKENLRGQALVMRAFYYFHLVNMYGKPYNTPGVNPENTPGVPLKLTMQVPDSLYPRNSVAEVYRQVEADLKAGAALMKANPKNAGIFKMSSAAAYTLLSRMYLYQEKWDESIAYSDSALAINNQLTQLSTYKARPSGGYYLYNNATTFAYGNRIYDPAISKEIIWSYRPIGAGTGDVQDEIFKSGLSPLYSNSLNPPYSVSSELLNLYDNRPITDTAVYLGDLRGRIYFNVMLYFIQTAPVQIYGFKFYGGTNGAGAAGIRVAELYLNRAEAKIQKAIKSGNAALLNEALNDINTLRSSRYDARKPYQNVTIPNPQDLLSFCRDERRREFPLEGGHRWFDLRRYGMPAMTHYYEEEAGVGQTATLAQGDNRYTLQIPNEVLNRNGNLVQNP